MDKNAFPIKRKYQTGKIKFELTMVLPCVGQISRILPTSPNGNRVNLQDPVSGTTTLGLFLGA
jgi:hypothetical protein